MTNLQQLPDSLPTPKDDGLSDHLLGFVLPSIHLQATNGDQIDLSLTKGYLVIYCYPMTGQPNVSLPEGWNQIPGARGCTPQNCSFRDYHNELKELGAKVFGLSTQETEYQKELAERLHLPFSILSDSKYDFQRELKLPTFEVAGKTLLKRLTMIVKDGVIVAVHYPVFPSDQDPVWVINYLNNNR